MVAASADVMTEVVESRSPRATASTAGLARFEVLIICCYLLKVKLNLFPTNMANGINFFAPVYSAYATPGFSI
jgi:hypothetical protein